MTVGLVMQEAIQPLTEQIANARASRRALSSAARARFAQIAPELARLDEHDLFSFAVEQAAASVELQVERSKRR
jgi:hypothetical protein